MEIQIILLVIFTALVCNGVHAVTRPNMLLWFLGVRIHALDKVAEIQQLLSNKVEALFSQKEQKINDAFDNYGGDTQSEGYQKEIDQIEDWYEKELGELNERFAMQIDWHEKRANLLAQKPIIAFLLSIAPALTECLTCMASVWGSLIFALYFGGALLCPFILFPFFLFALAGLNTIILNKAN